MIEGWRGMVAGRPRRLACWLLLAASLLAPVLACARGPATGPVLVVGDSLSSDVQGGVNAGLDTCWYNPNHAENPGKVVPTYEISSLEELYPLVMEPEELANVGLKNRRHQL